MQNRQKQGDSLLNTLSQQVTNFFEAGMDKNTPNEWLVLLLISSTDEAPTWTEIFKRTEEIKDYHDIIRITRSVESGVLNSNRLLGRGATVRQTGNVGEGTKCFRCNQVGHRRADCKVASENLYCQHCNKKGKHNTNTGCKMEKKKSNEKDNGDQGKKDSKKTEEPNRKGARRGKRQWQKPHS